jgi:hypothetical protein
MQIIKNGTDVILFYDGTNGAANLGQGLSFASEAEFTAGDYIEIFGYGLGAAVTSYKSSSIAGGGGVFCPTLWMRKVDKAG